MSKTRKIILLSSEFPPLPGGIGNHAYHLARQLRQNNYEVTVCTDQRSSVLADDLTFDNQQPFTIHRIKRYSFSLLTYLQRILIAFRLVIANKPDVIILSGKFSLWLGAFLKFSFPKKQFLAVLHGSELFAGDTISQKVTHWSLKQFDDLIAVSHFTKNLALKVDASLSITVINNGFSLPDFPIDSNKKTLKGYPKLVTVGNVTYRKGQQNVIEAIPKIKAIFPEVHYHCIGLQTEKKIFEKLAHKLGVLDAVTFHGALSNDDLYVVVASCDVFMMLSQRLNNGDVEGFGIAVLEANALGLPSIGSSDSGIADAIKDNYSGKLVLPNDVESVSKSLKAIIDDYDSYSANAKIWSEDFKWPVVIKNYLKVIEK